jgi:hypothetical protein
MSLPGSTEFSKGRAQLVRAPLQELLHGGDFPARAGPG